MRLGICSKGGKNHGGNEIMINKYDPLKAGLRPLLAKTLQNALSHRIAKEFPRIGGPRICKLCAEMTLEVVDNHIRPKENVRHGQIVWNAVSLSPLMKLNSNTFFILLIELLSSCSWKQVSGNVSYPVFLNASTRLRNLPMSGLR